MKNTKKDYSDIGFLFYICTAVISLIIFFGSLHLEKADTIPELFADNWYVDEEMIYKADLKRPILRENRCDFYARVPDTIKTGDCLWFKAKNAYITVTVGDEVRAQITDGKAAFLYGKTPGTDWVYVPFDVSDISKVIHIDFYTNYKDTSAYIDSVYIGNSISVMRFAFSDRIVGMVLCVILMFSSFVLLIVYCVLKRYIKDTMPKELLYLSFCVFFAALWSLSELRLMQLFTDKSAGVFHNLTCMTLMLFIMPLIYCYKEDLEKSNKYIVPVMTGATVLNFVLCTGLHFLRIADFHETLIVTYITIGMGAVSVIYANFLRCFKNPEREKADIPPAVCMILVGLAAVIDMFRYSGGGINDTSFYSRIAIFAFAVALGVCCLVYVVEMVERGMRAEIISHLAYEDGLTGLGNRTAYSEKMEEIDGVPTTIFVFDINNLKTINDTLGHQSGDELIKAGADLIASVFGKLGNCYRIGGDEFVCLLPGKIEAEEYAEVFYRNISSFNQAGALPFPLMIALGFEYYDGVGDIKEAVGSADRKMYEKKAELKKKNPM